MGEHEFELREVPHEPPGAEGERLQESVAGDVAASVAALANVGMLGYAAATFHRERHDAAEARHEAEMAVLRAARDAEMRVLRARGFGFGVDEDYYPGFGMDDDYFGGL